jgi:hypothetical protein
LFNFDAIEKIRTKQTKRAKIFGLKKSSAFQPLWDNFLREEITDYLTVFLRLVYAGIFVLLLFATADIPQGDFSWSGAVMAGMLVGVIPYYPAEFPAWLTMLLLKKPLGLQKPKPKPIRRPLP